MIYVVYFSSIGVPVTGLSPTLDVYKKVSDATDVTPAPTVSEIGGGFYKFSAAPTESLVVRVNSGGTLIDVDKYKVMQITPNDASLDAAVSTRAPENGGNVAAIKAKTDNLPSDPASNTQVNTRLATSGYTAPDNAGISAVKAKTDNLPADPASNTQVNTRLAAASYAAPDNAGIGAIKAKTDNLPAVPAIESNVQGHVADALAAYDPPTRDEATADKAEIAAMVEKIRKVHTNRLVVDPNTGSFTIYDDNGLTPLVTGTISSIGRSVPTWP
jgi:hypothetical protein